MSLPRFEKLRQDLTDMGMVYSLVIGVVLLVFLGRYVASDRASFDLKPAQVVEEWNVYRTDE